MGGAFHRSRVRFEVIRHCQHSILRSGEGHEATGVMEVVSLGIGYIRVAQHSTLGGTIRAEKEFSVASQPLSDAEFDRLSDILGRLGNKRVMNLEQLDGFLAAVICSPEQVPQSVYLRQIWGCDIESEDGFTSQSLLQDAMFLIIRHRDAISHILRSGEAFTPLLLEDEYGVSRANDWAMGFMRGMELHREKWASLLDDDENAGSLVPIFALAHEHDPDPELRPYKEPPSAELRDRLIVGAAAGVMRIYRYFEAQRLIAKPLFGYTTYRRVEPKVGRNEPCPCGSGKKFKQCCGKTTLH